MRSHKEPFGDAVNLELARAKRYRVFVSMVSFDLADIGTNDIDPDLARLVRDVQGNVRAIDRVALLGGNKLVLLMPETARQGAELAAKRVASMLQKHLGDQTTKSVDRVPLEMASYPDAAGTQTIPEMLEELVRSGAN